MPYRDFVSSGFTFQLAATEPTVPNAIVNRVFDENITPMRAWREHLGFTQAELAERAGTSQASYAQTENRQRPRKSTLRKIAKGMGPAYELINTNFNSRGVMMTISQKILLLLFFILPTATFANFCEPNKIQIQNIVESTNNKKIPIVFNGFQILIKNNQLKKIIHSDDMIIMVLNNGKTITERTLSHEDIEILTNEHSDPVNKIKMLLGVIESSNPASLIRWNQCPKNLYYKEIENGFLYGRHDPNLANQSLIIAFNNKHFSYLESNLDKESFISLIKSFTPVSYKTEVSQ